MQDVEFLLEGWARWCAIRDDGGLGYATSGLNRLMSGQCVDFGANFGGLPYGVDVDAVFAKIDAIICALPEFHKIAVCYYYRRLGTLEAKARCLGVSVRTMNRYLDEVRNQVNQEFNQAA